MHFSLSMNQVQDFSFIFNSPHFLGGQIIKDKMALLILLADSPGMVVCDCPWPFDLQEQGEPLDYDELQISWNLDIDNWIKPEEVECALRSMFAGEYSKLLELTCVNQHPRDPFQRCQSQGERERGVIYFWSGLCIVSGQAFVRRLGS